MSHRPRPSARRAAVLVSSAVVLSGLAAPMLASPADAALTAPQLSASSVLGPKTVQLRWAPVADATSYVVQVGQDDEWSDTPTLSLTTVSSSINLPVWLPHASYTWRVAAVTGAAQGPWSSNGTTFARAWATTADPISPVGAQTDLPEFSWTPVAGASEYQVQVSSRPFGTPATEYQADDFTTSCFTTRTRVTPYTGQKSTRDASAGDCDFSGLPYGGSAFWRVRPLDAVADTVEEVDTTPVVDEGISSQPPALPGTLDTTACPTKRPEGALSCEPKNAVEKGAWSSPAAFSWTLPVSIATDVADLPTVTTLPLATPECDASAVCTDAPTIRWTRPDVAGTTPTSYRVYIGLDPSFSNIQSVVETPGTSWTPTTEFRVSGVGPAYYYAVQACRNTVGEETDPGYIEGGCGPVAAPAVIPSFKKKALPVSGLVTALPVAQENRLSWNSYASALQARTGSAASSEAAAYRVQVAKASDPSFTTPIEDVKVDGLSYISKTTRLGDGSFLWRVQAVDASGHKLPWSTSSAFTRDFTGPMPVTTTAPVANVDPSAKLSVTFSEPVVGTSPSTVALTRSGVVVPSTVSSVGSTVFVKPTQPLLPGATYVLATTTGLTDGAGNPAAAYVRTLKTPTVLDNAHPAVAYSGRWAVAKSTAAVGGSFQMSNLRGSQAGFRFQGVATQLTGCVSPSSGFYEVWVDGKKRLTADAYRSFSGCGVLATISGLTRSEHVVVIRVLGAKRAASKGLSVGFDSFRVAP